MAIAYVSYSTAERIYQQYGLIAGGSSSMLDLSDAAERLNQWVMA